MQHIYTLREAVSRYPMLLPSIPISMIDSDLYDCVVREDPITPGRIKFSIFLHGDPVPGLA